jgi:hypothetical protein
MGILKCPTILRKAIKLLRKTDNSILASALLNAGIFKNKKYDLALRYFRESGEISRKRVT